MKRSTKSRRIPGVRTAGVILAGTLAVSAPSAVSAEEGKRETFAGTVIQTAKMRLPGGGELQSADDSASGPDAAPASAEEGGGSSADLAKQLANPIAALISLPLQNNFDFGLGSRDEGFRYTLNVQPVIPLSISERWNLISRTILPVVAQNDVLADASSQSGLGDTVQSFFFSPKSPTSRGLIWGLGPVMLLPTATDDVLGAGKWGAGPTFVGLKQAGPWTYGVLLNHIWSIGGDADRSEVSGSFLQPFVSYTTRTAVTVAVNTETSYDWENESWAVPLNLSVSKVVELGGQLVSLGGGVKYWASSAEGAPEGFGFRVVATLLFPK